MNLTSVESERYCKYFNPVAVDCTDYCNPLADEAATVDQNGSQVAGKHS